MFKWFRKKELSIRDRPVDLAGACYCIAAADGELHEAEARQLSEQVHELAGEGHSLDDIERMVRAAHEALERGGLDAYLRGLGRGMSVEARSQLLGAAAAIAGADGKLAKEERYVYFKLAAALGFAHDKADAILTAVTAPPPVTKRSASLEGGASGADTERVSAALRAAGWVDPRASLVEAGIEVEGFGAAVFQYQGPRGALLRLEHHPDDQALHFRVTDEADVGSDLVLVYRSQLDELLALIVRAQDELTPQTLDEHRRAIAAACPEVRILAETELSPLPAGEGSGGALPCGRGGAGAGFGRRGGGARRGA
ncbi:MAG TPA: TerB family tellurite resistance protein [Polyangiaceae bacterium]|nr:TerB family tellurite resistance protein [Polyangiaceae bacterium]